MFKEGMNEGIISGLTTIVSAPLPTATRIIKMVSVLNVDPNSVVVLGLGIQRLDGTVKKLEKCSLNPGDKYSFGDINEVIVLSGLKSLVGFTFSGVSTNYPEFIASYGDSHDA